MRRFLNYWLPPLAWAAMILAASSDLLSASHTGGWIERITSWLGHSLTPPALDLVNLVVRKAGHLTAYALLGALSFRALRGERPSWSPRWAIGAVAFAVVVAAIDEFHQSFVPSRTGTWHDILLDASGAALMQIIIRTVQVLLSRRP